VTVFLRYLGSAERIGGEQIFDEQGMLDFRGDMQEEGDEVGSRKAQWDTEFLLCLLRIGSGSQHPSQELATLRLFIEDGRKPMRHA
jgi:hypothetical protein